MSFMEHQSHDAIDANKSSRHGSQPIGAPKRRHSETDLAVLRGAGAPRGSIGGRYGSGACMGRPYYASLDLQAHGCEAVGSMELRRRRICGGGGQVGMGRGAGAGKGQEQRRVEAPDEPAVSPTDEPTASPTNEPTASPARDRLSGRSRHPLSCAVRSSGTEPLYSQQLQSLASECECECR